jgi:hypothetical protein
VSTLVHITRILAARSLKFSKFVLYHQLAFYSVRNAPNDTHLHVCVIILSIGSNAQTTVATESNGEDTVEQAATEKCEPASPVFRRRLANYRA